MITETAREPERIRITPSALPGTIAAVPIGSGVKGIYEVLVHPEDFATALKEINPITGSYEVDDVTHVLGLPVAR